MIGVVKDMHFGPVRVKSEPMMLWLSPNPNGMILLKLESSGNEQTIKQIERVWETITHGS